MELKLKKSMKTTKNGKAIGRPNLPEGKKIIFQRIAVWPKTYIRIKFNASLQKKGIAEYLEDTIE